MSYRDPEYVTNFKSALADSVTQWGAVEHSLCEVFITLVGARDWRITAAAF